MIPLSLYIHFPWCIRKCPYCDFNSHKLPTQNPELLAQYTNKLLLDLEYETNLAPIKTLSSIYFGGGTPSLLPVNAIKTIIDKIKQHFIFANNIEITLEANPGTINLVLLQELKNIGVNRISLGIQSFADKKLQALGRIHDSRQAQDAINMIKIAGFTNFNLDLMFGLPEQTIDEAIADLHTALSFNPPHLSWYQLTLEPNTLFALKPPKLPINEQLWDMQQHGQDLLKQHNLLQYEVSAYSKINHECKHNINYWQYGDYLGIGVGAHGKITLDNHVIKRYSKISNPRQYMNCLHNAILMPLLCESRAFYEMQQSREIKPSMDCCANSARNDDIYTSKQIYSCRGIKNEEIINNKKIPFEFMLNALRLYQPITHTLFQERTGVTIASIATELKLAQDLELIELYEDKIITTEHGKNFLNNLLEIFL